MGNRTIELDLFGEVPTEVPRPPSQMHVSKKPEVIKGPSRSCAFISEMLDEQKTLFGMAIDAVPEGATESTIVFDRVTNRFSGYALGDCKWGELDPYLRSYLKESIPVYVRSSLISMMDEAWFADAPCEAFCERFRRIADQEDPFVIQYAFLKPFIDGARVHGQQRYRDAIEQVSLAHNDDDSEGLDDEEASPPYGDPEFDTTVSVTAASGRDCFFREHLDDEAFESLIDEQGLVCDIEPGGSETLFRLSTGQGGAWATYRINAEGIYERVRIMRPDHGVYDRKEVCDE